MTGGWMRWREAAERALYGPRGFYLTEAPAAHFRTSVHASPRYAEAVAALLGRVDRALGGPAELALVDIGAGRGELLTAVLERLPERLAARVRPCAVEQAARPEGLDPRIEWSGTAPAGVSGLLFANEWLDSVPVEVAEAEAAGTDTAGTDAAVGPGAGGVPRYVLVNSRGEERPGPSLSAGDAAWLARWWPPAAEPGARAEIGRPRDLAWAAAVRTLERGLAVAVDYGHTRGSRPLYGTLTGFRDGREVPPVPDGTCDLTSHVALDSCAAAAPGTATLCTQREALHALGVRGERPPLARAAEDPVAYLRALSRAGEAAELTDPAGLGGHLWLVQRVGLEADILAPVRDIPLAGAGHSAGAGAG